MKKLALHWQILIGIAIGILFGLLGAEMGWSSFIQDWIKPFGTIFINLLKMIAVPLIVTSLVTGVADLKDIRKLGKMGGRTFGIYVLTTAVAISVGLIVVNIIQPGHFIQPETREMMSTTFGASAADKIKAADDVRKSGPLQPLVDMVPDNLFKAATENSSMLKVIFFVVFFGIGLILIPAEKAKPVVDFFGGANEVIMKLIDIIMLFAPIGVFALLASLIVELPSTDLLVALLGYSFCVLLGLAILIFGFYPFLVKTFAKKGYGFFLKGIAPAQLLAFSTSSSAATLPVSMERAEEHLGVDEEVASFVLPIGATINMDGTALYQGVAAVFIAQAFGMNLGLGAQLGIILTATLASIGTAAVPGAGMVMLVIVLAQAGIPEAGLALIFAVDRPLDMCRTIANVTSDLCVSMIVAKSLDKLGEPMPKDL
ncbi:MAG: cation:dicarboxylase symporter family transporter [Bacteroidetes bacterium]|nr:cation:dicarboxylase symporter family transporter [Bacteroidota bacterium]